MSAEDVPAVLAIEIETNPLPWKEADFLGFLAHSSPGPGTAGAIDAADASHEKRAWVTVDPVVRGFACAVAVRPGNGSAGEAELQAIGVARKFWGQGMGAALIETVLAWAASSGDRVLHLEVRESNERALALYRRLGFTQSGRRPRYYQDSGEAALLMSKET